MGKKKRIIFILIPLLFIAALVGILSYYYAHVKAVEAFNAEEHVINGAFVDRYITDYTLPNLKTTDVTLTLRFRGGNTDTWTKDTLVPRAGFADFVGSIYEMRVVNASDYTITDWTIRQNIHQDCYINNAWCGQVEIHQFDDDGNENIQTLDLQTLEESQLKLNFLKSGKDILIPLKEGDYLIYIPSSAVNETPLIPYDVNNTGTISCGIIYYYYYGGVLNLGGMDLSDATISFKFQKEVNEGEEYEIFTFMILTWFCMLAVYLVIFVVMLYDSKKMQEREAFIDEALTVFTHFVDAKDPYTKGHSNRVAEYSRAIAKAIGLNESECQNVYYIALLHDVGKCYIDDDILKKPDRLTPEEFEAIKHHTTLGARMLEDFKSMPDIYNGALYHHERYDGKGYPSGRSGEDIPLIARIICVADSFDAMNSNRCYRPKLSPDVIISELHNNRGTQFDPNIADVFLKLLENGTISFD